MAETLLTVDTSSSAGSVAISQGERLLGEILLNLSTTHTDRLLTVIGQLLTDAGLKVADIDCFGVVRGPGSFTGLRVGAATVKGLALGAGKPVAAVSSLATLAMQSPFSRHPICSLLDARKKEVYAGLFRWESGLPSPIGDEGVLPPEKLLDSLEGEWIFLGEGSLTYRTLIVRRFGARAHFPPWPLHFPRASLASALVLEDFRQGKTVPLAHLAPHYIRPSEAEILWRKTRDEELIEG